MWRLNWQMLKEMHMKRNRMLALLLAGCMVLGNSNILLHAEEEDDQFFTIEEDDQSEIQEDDLAKQFDEEDDLYAGDLIEDGEEVLSAAETAGVTPEMFKITFDSRGGSEVDPQYVLPGDKATEPERPVKGEGAWTDGGDFAGWYTDEMLNNEFDFNTSINENITLFAKWYYGLSVCSYDISNQEYCTGGQFSVEYPGYFFIEKQDYSYGGSNFTLLEGNITLSAKPDQGYIFKGFYKGEIADAYNQTFRPLDVEDPDNLLSNKKEYTFYSDSYTIICPVFQVCTDHDFGPEQTINATTDAQGRVYHVCKNCGTEETIRVLPKLTPVATEPAAPAAPSEQTTISKKPIIKNPAAAKGRITVNWKHFKQTKKTKKVWQKIKKVQIQCATDKAFTNIIKTSMVGKKKTKATIKGLSKKTTYYVRVRYYDGTGYSKWSSVKKVKTKK